MNDLLSKDLLSFIGLQEGLQQGKDMGFVFCNLSELQGKWARVKKWSAVIIRLG
jgi:hypothetical protein